MIFSFDSKVAEEHGVTEAILYEFFSRILVKNMIDEVNHENGTFWTVASYAALSAVMPFYTERQIRYAMANLMEKGVILQMKKKHRNRTSWWGMPIEALQKLHPTKLSDEKEAEATRMSPPPAPKEAPANNNIISISNRNNIPNNKYINNNPPIVPPGKSVSDAEIVEGSNIADLVNILAKDRKERGEKMTERAKNLLFGKLSRMKSEGHDIESLVNTAIEHGWKTVYPPKQQYQGKGQQRPTYIRQGLNPDIIEEKAYEQFKQEQSGGNSNGQPPSNRLPNSSNGGSA